MRDSVARVVILYSADGKYRLEQRRDPLRLLYGDRARRAWGLVAECSTVAELAAWLERNGDPVDGWVAD